MTRDASRQADAAKATTATRAYDAFGMLVGSTGTPQGPFGFAGDSGYQEDADSGLKLLGHRYYDPSTGRFLTRNPAQDGRNWYAYTDNDPTSYTDPDGLAPLVLSEYLLILQGPLNPFGPGTKIDPPYKPEPPRLKHPRKVRPWPFPRGHRPYPPPGWYDLWHPEPLPGVLFPGQRPIKGPIGGKRPTRKKPQKARTHDLRNARLVLGGPAERTAGPYDLHR